jgi:hypothetical protein
MTEPHLTIAAPERTVRAIALVLHGGRATSQAPVRRTHLAVVRMSPFATSLQRSGAGLGLAVARLRYLVRGWNGGAQSPVPDVGWGLARIAARYPSVPVALVGHSMGGRAAIYSAAAPAVRTVVGGGAGGAAPPPPTTRSTRLPGGTSSSSTATATGSRAQPTPPNGRTGLARSPRPRRTSACRANATRCCTAPRSGTR